MISLIASAFVCFATLIVTIAGMSLFLLYVAVILEETKENHHD